MAPEPSDLLTFSEVAEILRVDVGYVVRVLVGQRRIPFVALSDRKRRIRRSDLDDYIDRHAGITE